MSIIIGLTGGSGSGKSTVALCFKNAGARIIDADRIARDVVAVGRPALAEIANTFTDVLLPDGSLNRKKLGAIVFSDKNTLAKLNKITHAYIIKEIKETLENHPQPLTVIDAPLLFECGLEQLCSVCIAVLSDRKVRLERIMKRDGLTEALAKSRIDVQPDDDFYRTRCDYVIENNQDQSALKGAIDDIIKELSL